jgi:hypothetical protein
MTGRMDWRKAHLHGRPTLDYRHEHDRADAADRWIAKALSKQGQRRQHPRERRAFSISTQASSAWGA